jgi:glycosyltransferase involved in cell wall biosynthesis
MDELIFVGGNPLSGIGQVTNKYATMMGVDKVYTWADEIPPNKVAFIFALPIPNLIQKIKNIQSISKAVHCMCVCETETVHPVHGELFKLFDEILTPSEFCRDVFARQFPDTKFKVLHHWIEEPSITIHNQQIPKYAYTFYHIGNVLDHRKQVKKIVEAFMRLNLPDACLVLKATCLKEVTWKLPNVIIINGLLPDDKISEIHKSSDCYVSFSHSEGVGMGAVEAALHDKPVIIPEYGGASDYIKTPYTIGCKRCKVGVDDFLYTKDMEWGDPDFEQLKEFMLDAYTKKLSYMSHTHTRNLIGQVKNKFKTYLNL